MKSYHDLCRYVLTEGDTVPTRAVLASTGEPVDAVSVFGAEWQHDLRTGFPLLTTKRMALRPIAVELDWFLRGLTNVRWLQERDVTIWDEWADAYGDLGPVYGAQWRGTSGASHQQDQIARILGEIRNVVRNPAASEGRRILLNSWNVADVGKMKLPPCHYAAQWSVRPARRGQGKRLDALVQMRSADLFLGVPYNIASYALLTHALATVTGLSPGILKFSFGDLHIYTNHLSAVHEQLTRAPYVQPALVRVQGSEIPADLRETSLYSHYTLWNYQCHGKLSGEVAVLCPTTSSAWTSAAGEVSRGRSWCALRRYPRTSGCQVASTTRKSSRRRHGRSSPWSCKTARSCTTASLFAKLLPWTWRVLRRPCSAPTWLRWTVYLGGTPKPASTWTGAPVASVASWSGCA